MVFQFTSIRNIPLNQNYSNYIVPITMLQSMISGHPINIRKPEKRDLKYMTKLLSETAADFGTLLPGKSKITTTTPSFVKRLFTHFTINVTKVTITMNAMDQVYCYGRTLFGFKMFCGLFMHSDGKTFNTSLMINVFKNLKCFVLFRKVANLQRRKWDYCASVELNDIFFRDIFESIRILNQRTSSPFKSFMFVKPSISSIQSFIVKNQQKFEAMNWYLSIETYKDKERGDCDECLCVSKLKR